MDSSTFRSQIGKIAYAKGKNAIADAFLAYATTLDMVGDDDSPLAHNMRQAGESNINTIIGRETDDGNVRKDVNGHVVSSESFWVVFAWFRGDRGPDKTAAESAIAKVVESYAKGKQPLTLARAHSMITDATAAAASNGCTLNIDSSGYTLLEDDSQDGPMWLSGTTRKTSNASSREGSSNASYHGVTHGESWTTREDVVALAKQFGWTTGRGNPIEHTKQFFTAWRDSPHADDVLYVKLPNGTTSESWLTSSSMAKQLMLANGKLAVKVIFE